MNVTTIEQQIKILQQKMNVWPNENVSEADDRKTVLDLTDAHFYGVEANLDELLNHCKMLPAYEQSIIAPSLKKLKTFVEDKFARAEAELSEIKNRMGQGRSHAQAIRAYTKL